VSSSRNSSPAAAFTAITAPIRSEQIRDRVILWLQRRKGNVTMRAFPGQSKVDVREKLSGRHVLSGRQGRADPIPTRLKTSLNICPTNRSRLSVTDSFHDCLPCISSTPVRPDQGSSDLISSPSRRTTGSCTDKYYLSPRDGYLVT